jgi:hypothetical protein
VIDSGFGVPRTVVARTSFVLFALSADSIMSIPQHFFACFRMFPVDFASLVSKYCHISLDLWRQFLAAPRQPSTYSMVGVALKKAYIGAVQSLASRSERMVSLQKY